jgi:hypothetical protein
MGNLSMEFCFHGKIQLIGGFPDHVEDLLVAG